MHQQSSTNGDNDERKRTAEMLRKSEELNALVADLRKAIADMATSRRATLNLLEDAVQARDRAEQLNAELSQRQAWGRGQRAALEAAVNDASLETSLGMLARTIVEALGPDIRAAFYLANDEGTALHHIVGMPSDYAAAVNGFKIGPQSLACGLATYTGEKILTTDVRTDPRWGPWLWMAERFDYRGCWSFPFHTLAGRHIGTLAVYARHPREATERDVELASLLTNTASIIISRHAEAEVRKKTENALREADARLVALFKSLPVGVGLLDLDGGVVLSNPEFKRFMPDKIPSLDSEVGRRWEGWDQAERPVSPKNFPNARALRGESFGLDMEFLHTQDDGGKIWTRVISGPIRDSVGRITGAFSVISDIDALKRHQDELMEALLKAGSAQAEAEAATHAKDHFLAVLSHELRTPLTPIFMATRTILRQKDLSSDIRDGLMMIERNIEVEARMIDELLDLTRVMHGKLELHRERMDVLEALKHALDVAAPDIEAKGQKLIVELAPASAFVDGDSLRLEQTFWNVLKNASKFTPEQGEIHVASQVDDEHIVITVSDTGAGIPAEALASIFDPFIQADESIARRFGGLGLGLALARATIDGHGGGIAAHSDGKDRGAMFTIRLPLM